MIEEKSISDNRFLSYEEILNFVSNLENETLEDKYTPDELRRINYFIARLAREGQLDSDDEDILEQDIKELLEEENIEYIYPIDQDDNTIISSVLLDSVDIVLCKHFFSNKWKQTKHFVKKHKKVIIVGAGVVVGVTIAVVEVANSICDSMAEFGGGTYDADQDSEDFQEGNNESFLENKTSTLSPSSEEVFCSPCLNENSYLSEVIGEKVTFFKEKMVKNSLLEHSDITEKSQEVSFRETAKEFGAQLAHETLESLSQLASFVPQITEEIKEVGKNILPKIEDVFQGSPRENYEELVAIGHKTIDKVFSTNQLEYYTQEAKENLKKVSPDFDIGILPPPSISLKKLANAGKKNDRGGLSKAGRALAKHGARKGSVYPKPTGSPLEINQQGQDILDYILNNPQKTIKCYKHPKFGKVIDIKISGNEGVRYYRNGKFIGFLEP